MTYLRVMVEPMNRALWSVVARDGRVVMVPSRYRLDPISAV